jgi:hypothetical protein
MDDKTWFIAAIIAVIVIIPMAFLAASVVRYVLKQRENLGYKTLEEHGILNASDREAWMSGRIGRSNDGEEEELDRFSARLVPIAQLVTMVVFSTVVILWGSNLVDQNAQQNERIADLELQVHALSIAPAIRSTPPSDSADSGLPTPTAHAANPMQQACANLIGRVADAYAQGASSKIGESLEALVKKLGCLNNPAP